MLVCNPSVRIVYLLLLLFILSFPLNHMNTVLFVSSRYFRAINCSSTSTCKTVATFVTLVSPEEGLGGPANYRIAFFKVRFTCISYILFKASAFLI